MADNTDLLAQYRKNPKPVAGGAQEPYVAFDGKDRVERLIIHRSSDPTRSPQYGYLKDVAYDGEFGTNFALYFEFMIVLVRGKNLQPVVGAIQKGFAEYIREFDSDRWAKPSDDSAPFIETIEIISPDGKPSDSDSAQTTTRH